MKKLTVLILTLFLLTAFAACGSGGGAKVDTDKNDAASREETVKSDGSQLSEEDLDKAMDLILDDEKQKWPKNQVHPDMPEYGKGKLSAWSFWNGDNENDIFILIQDTNQEDLDAYIGEITAAGFAEVNGDTYRKDLYEVEFQFNSDTILQISSYKMETATWPKDLKGIPEIKKGNLTGVIEPSDDMPNYIQLYYINYTQADLDEWTKDLEESGFTVEDGSIYKSNMELGGKTYSNLYILAQENGDNEWMIDFSYEE